MLRNLLKRNILLNSFTRMASNKVIANETLIPIEEVQIKLPTGGFVAGKWWGDKSIRPFVCLHGQQDNAGTFDRLIPLLPKEFSYLAIDLPGHGRSSWLPHGVQYHTFGFLQVLTILMNEYKWSKLSLLAHSMSGALAFTYASIFPEKVDMLVNIESLKPLTIDTPQVTKILRDASEKFLIANQRNQTNGEPPAYTYDEMIEMLVKGSLGSVTPSTAKHLLDRNILPSQKQPGKFYFSRDNRMKFNLDTGISVDVSVGLGKNIKAPFLFIYASNSFRYEKAEYHEATMNAVKDSPLFESQMIDSKSHHLHLTEPEKIAERIGEFMKKHRGGSSHL